MNVAPHKSGFGWTLLILTAVLLPFFWKSLLPSQTLFSNDGPLARLESKCHLLPEAFSGVWEDLNAVGFREEGPVPDISSGLRYLLGPVAFSKFYAPIALLSLGLSAWCFFRQSGLTPSACALGALAAILNSSFFSAACWGVAAHPIMLGMIFLALAALLDTSSKQRWLRVALAGLAVGMGVNEAADIGAIFSLFVALFVAYQAWMEPASKATRALHAAMRLAVLSAFALFIAAQAVFALVETQIQGIAGTAQDTQTKQEHWDWATQWSLPKRELLSLAVPGLFGYRMGTDGAAYWGAVGRDASWERYLAANRTGPDPKGFIRYTGGGIYCGVLVLVMSVWAATQGFRRKESVFKPPERQWLRFWVVVSVVSVLFSFGRFAPFYRLLYALPWFSTIRNPTKFLHVLSFALVVLFAYGTDGLVRSYATQTDRRRRQSWPGLGAWWHTASLFEKRWVKGCIWVLSLSLASWVIYNGGRKNLIDYLQTVGFDDINAPMVAGFSVAQVGWFILFFVLAAGAITLFFSGAFAGRTLWGSLLLGFLLVVDLARANFPWVVYFDYVERYSTNVLFDVLRDKPYEHRVANLPVLDAARDGMLFELYRREWAQHQFPYFDIQSLDIVQLPREPADLKAFDKALNAPDEAHPGLHLRRRWELTNTRYFLGNARLAEVGNRQLDPEQRRFRTVLRFDIAPKPGVLNPDTWKDLELHVGPEEQFGLIEFTGALPRAGLYTHWVTMTNEEAVLNELTGASFQPENMVIVTGTVAPPATTPDAIEPVRKVAFESYAPKDIVLRADAAQFSVLLLNDRLERYWNVTVDGQRQPLLRCNYLMRGVWLPPGHHRVRFHFQPPVWPVWVSAAANAVGLVLLGVILATGRHLSRPQQVTQPSKRATHRPAPATA